MAEIDLFTSIHKSLRAMIYDDGRRLQPLDMSSPDSAGTLDDVARTLVLLGRHHEHEDAFVFPEVREFEPDIIGTLQEDHRRIEELLTVAGEAIARAREAAGGDSAQVGGELNRRFNELAAYYLSHLAHEELILIPATQKHFRDDELLAMRARITASIPPEDAAESLAWMLPALNLSELTEMFIGAKLSAPPEVLAGLAGIAEKHLDPGRWAMVRQAAAL